MLNQNPEMIFKNANQGIVPYDGSEITWRISAYAVVVKLGELLLAKSIHEKFYDVIGGGIEIGESIEEGLKREALEEAGADVNIGPIMHVNEDWFYHKNGRFYHAVQLYYLAELVGDLAQPSDPQIESVVWAPLDKPDTYPVAHYVATIIKKLTDQ